MLTPAYWRPHIIHHVAELAKEVNGKIIRASIHKADEKAASVERRSHDKRDGLNWGMLRRQALRSAGQALEELGYYNACSMRLQW